MANENDTYLFLLTLVFGTVLYTAKLIQVRSKRSSIMRKHKVNTPENMMYVKLLSTRRLVISIIASLLSVLLLAFDVYENGHLYDFLYVLALAAIVFTMSLVVVYFMFIRKQRSK